MQWIRVRLYTAREGLEPVFAALMNAGVTGVQIEDDEELRDFLANNDSHWDYVDDGLLSKPPAETRVTFYVSDNAGGRETLLSVKSGLANLVAGAGADYGRLCLETDAVDDEDWLNEWKKYYKPFRAAGRVVIRPAWEAYDAMEGDVVVAINPGPVFGTGLHESTRLCICQLEKRVRPGDDVLDLGCGSGILSVTALRLGAGSAFAVDMDQNAADAALENAALNNVQDRCKAVRGNVPADNPLLERLKQSPFDIVVANIVADVIIGILPHAPALLKPGGVFTASGVIRERQGDVCAAFEAAGLRLLETEEMDGWVCVIGEKYRE